MESDSKGCDVVRVEFRTMVDEATIHGFLALQIIPEELHFKPE
jgi:hypothetical protein